MRKLFFSLGLGMIFASCSKVDDHVPTITISSPRDNQTFSAGQMIPISISILDSSKIHLVHIRATNLLTYIEFIHLEQQVNVTTFHYDQSFIAEAGVNYTIEVEANNYNGNDTRVVVHVKGQ
jgi:Bacterial Ig domain